MAINNVVGVPLFPTSTGNAGITNASDAAQYVLNRQNTTVPQYPAYAAYPGGADASFASVSLLNHCNEPTSAVTIKVKSAAGVDMFMGGLSSAGTGTTCGFITGAKWGKICWYNGASAGEYL